MSYSSSCTVWRFRRPQCRDPKTNFAYRLRLRSSSLQRPSTTVPWAMAQHAQVLIDAFETLWLAGDAAVPLATQLCRSGLPAARAYGIILLSGLDELAAKRELPHLEDDSTTVVVLSGCIGMPQTVREIARLSTQAVLSS